MRQEQPDEGRDVLRSAVDGVYIGRVWRRVDPWGPVLAVLGLAVCLIHGLNGTLVRDQALYAYSGQQIAHGVPPYVGVMNRAGPIAHLVPGIGATIARILGTADLLTQRALTAVIAAGIVWATYLAGRDLFKSRAAGVIAATTLLTLRLFVVFSTGGSREKITMMLFLTLAVWVIVHRRWVWAGVFVSLATLTWQPAFFVGAVVALVAMTGQGRTRFFRSVLRFCLGGAIPAAVAVVAFAAVGALRPFLDGFFLINLEYTQQYGLGHFLTHRQDFSRGGYGTFLWVFLAGLVAALVGAVVVWFRREHRSEPEARTRLALGAGVVAAVAWSFKAYNGWPDSLVAAPLAMLGFAGLLHWLIARTPRPAILTAVFATAALVLAGTGAADARGDGLLTQRAQVGSIMQIVGPEATFASIAAPAPLVLAHEKNPVRYQMFTSGFAEYVDHTYPGGLAGLAQHLGDLRPTFITVDHGPGSYPWIKPLIRSEYTWLGRSADADWYGRDDLGEEDILRISSILGTYDLPLLRGAEDPAPVAEGAPA